MLKFINIKKNLRQYAFSSPVILLILILQFQITTFKAYAECKNCDKLKKFNFIGIKQIKRYLDKSALVITYSNERKAKKNSLQKFTGCESETSANKNKKAPCKPAFGVPTSGFYLCPDQLKPFNTEIKAQNADYLPFTSCEESIPTPTPTATPAVTPKPLFKSISQESGVRFSDADSISIAKLTNGSYRSYISESNDTFDGDTIRFTDSADGLTFGSKTAITGIAPENLESFANPSFLALNNGSFVLIYDEARHVSSAALDIYTLMRGISSDGINFTYEPEFAAIPGGSSLANYFAPSILQIDQSNIRLYYTSVSDIETLTSGDNGLTFTASEKLALLGRSSSYAPFPDNPSVVLEASGTYLLFFNSPADENTTFSSIYMADSSDGKTFHTFTPAILSGQEGLSYTDPNAIILPDGSIRLYYVERLGTGLSTVRSVKSLKLN